MQKGSQDNKWKAIFNEFSNYNGSIKSFCKENNISKDQFYYYKTKFKKADSSIFQAVQMNDNFATAKRVSPETALKVIRVEIGKAAILIPSDEISMLTDVIKELVKAC
ncbi:hypothetical protein IAI10_24335 [Clostridium sp. 19966]|uniref:IS66 family insertion sequence element accessory protein TnpA n=1 Tax=Clostridium sp. 19966 TaxID=2768166 RepID=UPI0028DF1132|nr:hypothetical protein [Clostridium sp. 19966]MDT8719754.1 hypothetical protein [Clostridium sp. 19966]